ncbi:hypothetical protein GOBAR_AA03638 [Gossypium barbadense]|nr:hypothetical protein GOBAR_AA03638 [Gossypium barbadense]
MAESFWDYCVLLINLVACPDLIPFDKFLSAFFVSFTFSFFLFLPIIICDVYPSIFTANVVLEGACERVIVGDLYCDIPLGLYVIRGENVVIIGELDLEKEELPSRMNPVSEDEIKRAQKAEREATDLKGSMRKRMEFLDFD